MTHSLPETPCQKCGKAMSFVVNADTDKMGPIDTKATVYVVFKRPSLDPWDDPAAVDGPPVALTGKKFLECLEHVVLNVGGKRLTVKASELIGFFPSHFSTCKFADEFSKGGRK